MFFMSDVYGVDIKDSFTFSNGDLELVSGTVNLGQAIVNRLNTDKGFYDWCYTQYGGNLFSIFGMKNNQNTLEYLKIEIESILQQDPRIKEVTANCSKENPKTINVKLDVLTINSNEINTLNLVIQDDLIVKLDTEGIDTNRIAMGDRV